MKNIKKIAAVIFLTAALTIFYLTTGSIFGDTVSWADVLKQINDIKTMSCMILNGDVKNLGEETEQFNIESRDRYYLKDPGKTRIDELYDDLKVGYVIATYIDQGRQVRLIYRMRGPEEYQQFISTASEVYPEENPALFYWNLCKEITSDQTKEISSKEIDGVAAVGFRAQLKDTVMNHFEGTIEIWVDAVTAIPIRLRIDYVDKSQGISKRNIMQDIQWNIPLADELFLPPPGWQLFEDENIRVNFTRTLLKDDITLRVGPQGGPPVFTEANVVQISGGNIYSRKRKDQDPEIVMIDLDVHIDQEAKENLHNYTKEHIDEILTVNFNGDFITRPKIVGPILTDIYPISLRLANLTLEQFEQKYLKEKYTCSDRGIFIQR